MRILLIEHQGETLCKLLCSHGYNVYAVRSGILAVTLLKNLEPFNLVIAVYFEHEGMGWLQLLKELKRFCARIPCKPQVLLMGQGLLSEEIQNAADTFLALPVEWQQLLPNLPRAKTTAAS